MHDDQPLTPRQRIQSLAAVIAAIAVVGVTLGLTLPLLSLILESRGTPAWLTGLSAAASAAALFAFSPFIPRIVGRIGLARLMLSCLIGEIAMLLALPVVDNVYGWFPLRFVMGMCASGLFVGTEAWISRIAPQGSRGRLIGLYAAVLSGGFALGPLLVPLCGIEGYTPFLVAAGCVAPAIPLLLIAAPYAPRLDARLGFGIWQVITQVPMVCAGVALSGLIESSMLGLLPPYLMRHALTPAAAAAMISVGSVGAIALQVPVGWLGDRYDRYGVMLLCGGASLLAALVLPWTVGDAIALSLTLFLWFGLGAGLYTVALALVGERFSGPSLVTANAALGLLYGFGSTVGPSFGGGAMYLLDPEGFPLSLALACGLFLVLAVGLRPWRKAAPGKPPPESA